MPVTTGNLAQMKHDDDRGLDDIVKGCDTLLYNYGEYRLLGLFFVKTSSSEPSRIRVSIPGGISEDRELLTLSLNMIKEYCDVKLRELVV